ncbi:MAG: hypothetical protein OXC09_08670 [Truepera sp.]|nr:hypothetical protein [Truepera sp.]
MVNEVLGNGLRHLFWIVVLLVLRVIFGRRFSRRLDTLEKRLEERPDPKSSPEKEVPDSVDSLEVWAIIDAYISPALQDKRAGIKIGIRRDFMDNFDKVTGAKVGENKYNRELLRQWIESNAARFLVENRHDMR